MSNSNFGKSMFSVRVNTPTKNWMQKITKDNDISMANLFDDLFESVNSGIIRYDNRVFHGEEDVERPKMEMRIAELMTEVNLQKAKIRGLEEELENFSEDKKDEPMDVRECRVSEDTEYDIDVNNIQDDDLDLRMLYEIAEKRRITPQSLLEMALRPYRC